ncbi:MAG: hypothetical protein JKY26_16470 [Pseudomonas sp.]|uniref:hypothetical protein n=1 Tax=Halopseudomonas sp. TaxID=2901191 RepID=UPI001A5A955B|nr:hypothetical protein [Pseudomonas sp.]|tara:strand:+ start:829 stop:1875 length:1047 start_codon:yes stop_codon:yes gene_type:complete
MNTIFREEDFIFTQLPVPAPFSYPAEITNGQAVLCNWEDDQRIGHSTFAFDDASSEALYAEKYHHRLINLVDREMTVRREGKIEPAGGALLSVKRGNVSVCWVPRETAEWVKVSYRHAQAIEKLRTAYMEILDQTDLEALFSYSQDISGLFLPCPAKEFFDGNPRYIICGQETTGWRNILCGMRNKRLVNEEDITASMQQAEGFARVGARRSKFMQFYRSAASRLRPKAPAAVLWSNQFSASFRSASPVNLPPEIFRILRELSYSVLRAQFEILQPDVVIFTTGPGRDRYLKECFTGWVSVKVIEPRRLWHFKVGEVHCIRTSHPRWVKGNEYLDRAVDLAKELQGTA